MESTLLAMAGGLLLGALGTAAACGAMRRPWATAVPAAVDDARRWREDQNLLGTLMESAPAAMIILRAVGTIVLSNSAARELLFEGQDGAGKNLVELLGSAPAPFRDAFLGEQDALFTVGGEGEAETYHLARRTVSWEGEGLVLIMVRHLTRELRKQEVAVWKKLLRVISHELNNSLAPISSMAHSARLIAKQPDKLHMLEPVFDTIDERSRHLKDFLEGYADLARLPAPRRARVRWEELLGRIGRAWPRVAIGSVPDGTGWLDDGQVEQVLVNLIKNAVEASDESAEITLDVRQAEDGYELSVSDRGPGMSEEVLRSALLPFYSTKERGTGLGLALCREIVEAHDGKIRLKNRDGGGLEVTCFFPEATVKPGSTARLTLTMP